MSGGEIFTRVLLTVVIGTVVISLAKDFWERNLGGYRKTAFIGFRGYLKSLIGRKLKSLIRRKKP